MYTGKIIFNKVNNGAKKFKSASMCNRWLWPSARGRWKLITDKVSANSVNKQNLRGGYEIKHNFTAAGY